MWTGSINGKTNVDYIEDELIGLPLRVWINKNDSLDKIIESDKYLKQYKDEIICSYRIIPNEKVVTINKNIN